MSKQMIQLLIIHIIRCKSVMAAAAPKLEVEDFNSQDEKIFRLIWSAVKEWFDKHSTTIPEPWLRAHIDQRLADDPGFLDAFQEEELHSFLDTVFNFDEAHLIEKDVLETLQEFVTSRKSKRLARDLMESGSNSEFNERLAKLCKVQTDNQVTTPADIDILTPGSTYDFSGGARTPTGVNWFDMLLGGGTVPGEVVGILGCPGGGKTTAGIQLCCEVAMSGRVAAYISYENEVGPQAIRRFIGYIAKIPRTILENAPRLPEDLPDQYKKQYLEATTRYDLKRNLKIIDMARPGIVNTGVSAIEMQLKKLHDEGTHVDLFVIDQLVPMVTGYMAQMNIKIENRRIYMQNIVNELVTLGRPDHMCTVPVILHQKNTTAKATRPAAKPQLGDAAEDRSFDNWLQFCIAFGNPDDKQRLWVGTTKSREAKIDCLISELDGENYRIAYKPGKYRFTGVAFVDSDAADDTTVRTAAETDRTHVGTGDV